MPIRNLVSRGIFAAIAVVALIAPLAHMPALTTRVLAAPPANSSISVSGGTCASYSAPECYVHVEPGQSADAPYPHTVLFTCGEAIGPAPVGSVNFRRPRGTDLAGDEFDAGDGFVPGCYDVTATVSDQEGGSQTFAWARCGTVPAVVTGPSVNCNAYTSPICPLGVETVMGRSTCTTSDTFALDQRISAARVEVAVNPATTDTHVLQVTFSGYTMLLRTCGTVYSPGGQGTCALAPGYPSGTSTAACPNGFTYLPGYYLSESSFSPPSEQPKSALDGVCHFTIWLKTR